MKLSEFNSERNYWTEVKLDLFENEFLGIDFLKNLKQFKHVSGKYLQINEEKKQWREFTNIDKSPIWQVLED